jgi:serine/threonine protein kinase
VVGIVVGSVALASVLAALLTFALLRRRSKYSRSKFEHNLPAGVIIKGVKGYTFAELAKATNDFSADHELGQGGYGKVYKGVLPGGVMVAIKRAQEGSMQGSAQFYTEIELLSRVHHRNLVSLLGYCNDRGEQMLVYEFMVGGTLRDHLIPTEILDFGRRLHIALGTARGILYLHTEADPPIFHRDIKASNILLDDRYNAKVADFGLSKLAPIPDLNGATQDHVSTVVKGTPGYLDPEYFLTQKLTDKTDVYSFGVVLLEIVTGMFPIAYGKNIVREVKRAVDQGEYMSIADPQMGAPPPKQALEPLLTLALACCQNESDARPRMVDIVRELEDIRRLTKPQLSKVDSDTFSIDMDHLQQPPPAPWLTGRASDSGRARYSTLEPSTSDSFQNMSQYGMDPLGKPNDFRSNILNPR